MLRSAMMVIVSLACALPGTRTSEAKTVRTCLRAKPARAATIGAGTCPVAREVDNAFAHELDDKEMDAFRKSVAKAFAELPEACVADLGERLARTNDCGAVFDAIAVPMLTEPNVPPEIAAFELLRTSPCQWKLPSALRETKRVDKTIVAAVGDLTLSKDEDVRASAWLTLGTLGRIADPDVATCIDASISRALATSHDRTLVAAAGNAGCETCRHDVLESLASIDPIERRTAVGSLRFLESKPNVDIMCAVLRTDEDANVRGAAAFALRHRTSFLDTRYNCLVDAATNDPMENVAVDAASSVEELAGTSDDPIGAGMLVQVHDRARLGVVRERSLRALRAYASEETLREIFGSRPPPNSL